MNKDLHNYFFKKENDKQNNENKIKSLTEQLSTMVEKVRTGSAEAITNARKWLSEKGEEAKNALTSNSGKVKQNAKTALAMLLILSTLVGTSACNNITDGGPHDKPSQSFENIPVRPIEEIEESGITAEDVLAKYDELATNLIKVSYGSYSERQELGDKYDKLDAQFVSIAPILESVNEIIEDGMIEKSYNRAFFAVEEKYSPQFSWILNSDGLYYKSQLPVMENSVYPVYLNIDYKCENMYDSELFRYFGVEKESMEKMLQSFGKNEFIMTEEFASKQPIKGVCLNYLDQPVYESITIDRDIIKNANEEQLWSLYDMINSMISINIYGENPNPDTDYEIELD